MAVELGSIRYLSTAKIVQMMICGWFWSFLQQGKVWENADT